jgi:hypothetical protein
MTTTDNLARRLHAAMISAPYRDWRKMYAGRKTGTGITLAGADTGKAWVRAEEDSREETQVWGTVTRPNLPVWVGPNVTGELEIKALEQSEAALTAGAFAAGSLMPPITPDNNQSLLIGGRQFKPGRMRLSDMGGLYVYVEPFHYDGGWWPGGSVELTPTATSGQQGWVAVALNPADGALYEFAGADFPPTVVMSENDIGTIAITAGYVPVGAVVLQEGQTAITGTETWADFHYHYAQAGGDIAGFVALAPASDTRNTIQPAGDHPAIIIKNNAAQTDNPFQTQTSAGAVNVAITPLGGVVVNEQGADADTRIEGDTDANLLFVDASTDRVGIGTNAPAQLLDVDGTAIIQTLMTDASTELTIATGAITVTQTFHRIDTEADASTDNLDTINGGADGQFLVIRAENAGREVVVTTAGNITTSDGNNVALDQVYKFLLLVYDGNRSKWNVVGGGGSGSGTYYQTIRDGGTPMTQRGKLNLIEGADITLTIADDAGNDETEVTIAYSGAGGSGTNSYSLCQGRLTLTSGTPVTTSDVTAATTVYFAPYKGNQIGLYNGSAWEVKTFSEISLSLSGYTASTPYDIWVYNNSGTVTLESTIWTNDTTRATALTTQDGVYVKTGATTRRYLGTIRITGTTGQTEDSVTKRFVWNYYNRVLRELTKTLTGGSYNSATWRQGQANTSNQVELVQGVAEDVSRFLVALQHQLDAGEYAYVGIGIDSTTTNSAQHNIETYAASSGGNYYSSAVYRAVLAAGYHYIAWLESVGSGTVTSARATLMGESFA